MVINVDYRGNVFLKIVLLGDPGVGKTSLIHRYCNYYFRSHYKATIGVDFITKEISVDGKSLTIQVWDTAGQERFHSLGTSFYRGADGCILTYDVTNLSSFRNLDDWKNEFLIQSCANDPDNFPFIVIGNKTDLPNREVSSRRAQFWSDDNNALPHFETSAKEFININEAFKEIIRRALIPSKDTDIFPPTNPRSQPTPLRPQNSSRQCSC